MSVSGYSVQHDFEVQEYNRRRAAWKASEKKRKQEEKSLRIQAKAAREAALQQAKDLGIGEKTKNKSAPFKWARSSRKEQSEKVSTSTSVFSKENRLEEQSEKAPTFMSALTKAERLDDESDGDSDEITLTDALAA